MQPFEYPLGGGVLTLKGDEVKLLVGGLVRTAVYPKLRLILESMKQACDIGLRHTGARIDEIRVLQGRIAMLADLTTLLELDLPAFYDEQTRKES